MRNFYRQHKTTRERIDNLAQRLSRKAGRKVSSREVLGFAESRKFFPEVISGHRCFPIGVADIIFEEMPLEVPAQVDKPLPTDEAIRAAWDTLAAGFFASKMPRAAEMLTKSSLTITESDGRKVVTFCVPTEDQLRWVENRMLAKMNDTMAHILEDNRILLIAKRDLMDNPVAGILPGFPPPPPEQVEEMRRDLQAAQVAVTAEKVARVLEKLPIETLLAEIARRGYDVTITRHAQTITIATNE